MSQTSEEKERKFFAPGWYPHLTNGEYHGSFGFSSTQIKELIAKPPAWLRHKMNINNEATENMKLGTTVHILVLEPKEFNNQIMVREDLNLRTKAGRETRDMFEAEAERTGKIVITESDLEKAKRMAENLGNFIADNRVLTSMIEGALFENSFFCWYHNRRDEDDETKYRVMTKAKIDITSLTHGVILDVKSCADASETAFKRKIERDFFYDVSQAMYLDVLNNTPEFVQNNGGYYYHGSILLCVENEPPYLPAAWELSKEFLRQGDIIYRQCMRQLQTAIDEKWPGYPNQIRTLEPTKHRQVPFV